MEILYLVCFFCIIAVTVVLLLRDNYIQKGCETRVKEITDKINEVNRFKYNADKSQYTRLSELENTVGIVKNNYVTKADMNKSLTTDSLVVKNISTDFAKINEVEIEDSLHSKGFGMVNPNGDHNGSRQECVTLEAFYNIDRSLIEGFAEPVTTKGESKQQGLVAQGYDLSTKEGVDVERMDVLNFSASQAKMKYATLDDGYFKAFSSGTGTFDSLKSKDGVFDTLTSGEFTAQKGTLNNMMINDSTLKNARWESGTADKMIINTLKAVDVDATKTRTNTLYTPQGEVVTLKSEKADIDTVLSKSAVIDNIKNKKMTSDELISKYVTSTERLRAPIADFDGLTSKRVTGGEITGDQGTFKSIYADVARIGGKISSTDKICVNNACLDTEMIELINKNPPGGINNTAFFRGGQSEFNPKNEGTRFADTDGRNYIRGDTTVDGHAKFAGNLEVNGRIKMFKANPGAMVETQNGVNQADRYGIGQFQGGDMRTYASSTSVEPSTVSMSFAKNNGQFNDVLTVTNDNVATINGRLDTYNAVDKDRMSFGVAGDKRGIVSEGDKDFNIYTNNQKAFTVANGGTAKVKGDLAFNGGNNWIFHTPDDGRDTLYVAPSKQKGTEDWNWESQTRFEADGSIANRQGKMYLGDNLEKGASLYFGGTKNNNTHDASVIENKERLGNNQGSELLIFKGGDVGRDRVRVRGGEIAFDVYDSNTKERNAENIKGKFTADGLYIDNKICFGTGANPMCFDRNDISRIKNIQGIKGDTGDRGIQGVTGGKGDRGDTGIQGLTGPNGPLGPKGDIGPKGDTGVKGDIGPSGPPGTMDYKSVINATGGVVSSAPVSFTKDTNGAMIDKNMGSDNNRYGVGQYTNGVMRMYTAGGFQPATLNLSLAQANNTFDDVVQIKTDKSVNINGKAIFNDSATFTKDAIMNKLCVGSTCVDETKFKVISTGGGVDGSYNVQNKLFFKDPSYSTKANDTNNSDAYYMEKVIDGGNASSLRMTINDDADESFQIWGNSCATGDCGNGGTLQHKFQANGDAVHMGKLYVQKTTNSESEPIADFRHGNKSQGVGIGYNTISATGDATNQDLKLQAKGTGVVSVAGNPLVLSDYEQFSKANEPVEKGGNWTLGNDWPWDPQFRGGRVGYAHTQVSDDTDCSGYWIDYTVPTGMKQAYIVHLPWSNCRYFDVMGRNGNEVVFIKRVNSWNPQTASPNGNHAGTTAVSVAGVNRFQRIRIQGRVGQIHLMGVGWTREEGRAMETGYTHWDNIYNKPDIPNKAWVNDSSQPKWGNIRDKPNIPDLNNPTFAAVKGKDWVRSDTGFHIDNGKAWMRNDGVIYAGAHVDAAHYHSRGGMHAEGRINSQEQIHAGHYHSRGGLHTEGTINAQGHIHTQGG
jgi:hypothetical protein